MAAQLGVDAKTVWRWSKASGVGERVAETIEQAVERGRKRLAASIDGAVATVIELVHAKITDRGVAAGARVRLAAATSLLDRVGLHPKQEIEVGDNTLTALFDRYAADDATPS